jgi:hypothetical protein
VNKCELWWAFVMVVGASGMRLGPCRLSSMVVFVVVGGVVSLKDVVVEERSNVTRCNIGIV